MDTSDRVFQARLGEYISSRDEIFRAIANQHTTLTFGTAALAAAFGAGFLSWHQSIAPAILFGIVPLSWWILMMWLGEVVRMLRAVEFCTEQEKIVNDSTPSGDPGVPALRWEQWRQDADAPWRTITWTYLSVGAALAVADVAALLCASITAHPSGWASWVVVLIWAAALLGGFFLARWVVLTFETWSVLNVGMPLKRLLRIVGRIPLARPDAREDHRRRL